jgi:hypothetical protein
MQDDSNDWEKESAQMFSTYNKADLTLAAAASEDPESPLMRPFVPSLPVIHDGRSFALRIQLVHSAGGAEPLFNRAWTCKKNHCPDAFFILETDSFAGNVPACKSAKIKY